MLPPSSFRLADRVSFQTCQHSPLSDLQLFSPSFRPAKKASLFRPADYSASSFRLADGVFFQTCQQASLSDLQFFSPFFQTCIWCFLSDLPTGWSSSRRARVLPLSLVHAAVSFFRACRRAAPLPDLQIILPLSSLSDLQIAFSFQTCLPTFSSFRPAVFLPPFPTCRSRFLSDIRMFSPSLSLVHVVGAFFRRRPPFRLCLFQTCRSRFLSDLPTTRLLFPTCTFSSPLSDLQIVFSFRPARI